MIVVKVDDIFTSQVDSAYLQRAVQITLAHQNIHPETDLSIVITDNEKMQTLNTQYRGLDTTTDVLSFPADFIDPDTEKPYLGDVIISYTQCQTQAHVANNSTEQELMLLVIHGVLHLLDHDHLQADGKKRMWTAQAEILKQLGFSYVSMPA